MDKTITCKKSDEPQIQLVLSSGLSYKKEGSNNDRAAGFFVSIRTYKLLHTQLPMVPISFGLDENEGG